MRWRRWPQRRALRASVVLRERMAGGNIPFKSNRRTRHVRRHHGA
jgi:uncharacterized membrane protein